jgi:ribosome-binding ATPase YchF (GTP1/OBG family)
MQKGFIRAEILAFKDLESTGSYPEARKKGLVRLEGKSYPVADGDIMEIRFNV